MAARDCKQMIYNSIFFWRLRKHKEPCWILTQWQIKANEHHRRHRIAVERIFHANKEADGHTMEDRELWPRDTSCKSKADGHHGKDRIAGKGYFMQIWSKWAYPGKTGLRANKISCIPFEIPKSQKLRGSLNICDLRKTVKVWQNLYSFSSFNGFDKFYEINLWHFK